MEKNYLIVTDSNVAYSVTGKDELKEKLYDLCLDWYADSRYKGKENGWDLFQRCWKEKDFGDICVVYELNGSLWDDEKIKMKKIL